MYWLGAIRSSTEQLGSSVIDLARIDGVQGDATHAAFFDGQGPVLDAPEADVLLFASAFRAADRPFAVMVPIPVVSDQFAAAARAAIDAASPTRFEANAVNALLEAPSAPSREQAQANAATVVSLAKALDAALPESRTAFDPVTPRPDGAR